MCFSPVRVCLGCSGHVSEPNVLGGVESKWITRTFFHSVAFILRFWLGLALGLGSGLGLGLGLGLGFGLGLGVGLGLGLGIGLEG